MNGRKNILDMSLEDIENLEKSNSNNGFIDINSKSNKTVQNVKSKDVFNEIQTKDFSKMGNGKERETGVRFRSFAVSNKFSQSELAELFGYASVGSFKSSKRYGMILRACDAILKR